MDKAVLPQKKQGALFCPSPENFTCYITKTTLVVYYVFLALSIACESVQSGLDWREKSGSTSPITIAFVINF